MSMQDEVILRAMNFTSHVVGRVYQQLGLLSLIVCCFTFKGIEIPKKTSSPTQNGLPFNTELTISSMNIFKYLKNTPPGVEYCIVMLIDQNESPAMSPSQLDTMLESIIVGSSPSTLISEYTPRFDRYDGMFVDDLIVFEKNEIWILSAYIQGDLAKGGIIEVSLTDAFSRRRVSAFGRLNT